jgi:peptidoglycan/xylan/chitin deacetylase (PgdA/CDA1 family)
MKNRTSIQRNLLAAAVLLASLLKAQADVVKHYPNEEDAKQAIQVHRLKHLEAKRNIDPETLKANCRYESEISTAPPKGKVILSFDDGPDPSESAYILEVLAKHNISGTFFLVGHRVQQHPELVEEIRSKNVHIIGNHSWSHPNFHELNVREELSEIENTRAVLPNEVKTMFFRYPYGNSTCEGNEIAHKQGYRIVGWHVDSCDWAFDHHGSVDAKEALSCGVLPQNMHNFVEHVISSVRAHNGGILLMHEIHHNTLHQLEEIIIQLKSEGFDFTNIEDPTFTNSLR